VSAGSFQIETPRMFLQPWESHDWEEFRPITQDPLVLRYVSEGTPWPEKRIIEFVARQRRHFERYGHCFWKILLKANGRLGGFCGLQPLEDFTDDREVVDFKSVEIGWWLASDLWGTGLATEAARAALADGFQRVGLARIVALALKENRASLRVMEKLGMQYEKDATHRGYSVVQYAIAKARFAEFHPPGV